MEKKPMKSPSYKRPEWRMSCCYIERRPTSEAEKWKFVSKKLRFAWRSREKIALAYLPEVMYKSLVNKDPKYMV
ncbi:hypothetical protein L1987_11936 [Smallanthus sonchifolius]|uniref:Uncharacterized protein n=1 Tax=Smallanthus sonchifolius TaxID=185202 RepID=A0ACB9JEP2_9ASTR|nr:hypothetical protein L1987_11936 [Smallanthus sonchifolius]